VKNDQVFKLYQPGRSTLLDIFGIHIKSANIQRLAPQVWLDDSLVDFTVNKVLFDLKSSLIAANLQVHVFPTTIFSLVRRDYANPIEGLFKNYRNIDDIDYLFFPIAQSNHFSCGVVENVKALFIENNSKDVRIHHMDSMNGAHNSEEVLRVIKHYLYSKAEANNTACKAILNASSLIGALPTPQQTNGWDCGLFIAENIKHFLQGAIVGEKYNELLKFRFNFSQSNISTIRSVFYTNLQQLLNHNTNNLETVDLLTYDTSGEVSVQVDCEAFSNQCKENIKNITFQNESIDMTIMTDESSLGDNNNNNNIGNISNTITELSKSDIQWDFTSECNTAKFFNSTERRYHSFKFPLQCTNAPQRVLMYYREDYFPFVIYAHYGVDAVAVKGKLYFSMCALFHSTYGSNFILAAIAFTTCTSPVKRYWVYDRAAKRFLEWTDKQISSFS